MFEDHNGESITFREFFRGQPSVVVFFYTRCDNPMKCSLTVEKLARVQKLLEAQGLADQIHTQRLLPTIQRLTLPHAFAFMDTTEAYDWIVTIEC